MFSQIFLAAITAAGSGGDVYVAGASAFLGQFMSLRNKLKVNRVANFIEEIGEYFDSIDRDFNWKNVDRNDFGDFFEMLLLMVSNTDSRKKMDRFKKLLVNQMNQPKPMDMIQRYLDLVSDLTENEILILKHIHEVETKWHKQYDLRNKLTSKLSEQSKSIKVHAKNGPIKSIYDDPRLNEENQINLKRTMENMKGLELKRKDLLRIIEYPEIEYSMNVLQNKWLANNYRMQKPEAERLTIFALYELTDFGKNFIEFLNND